MSNKQAKTDVFINAEQAKAALKEVQAELVKVKTLRDKAMAEGDVKGYNQLNAEFKKLTIEAGKLERASKDVDDVLKNMSTASIKELNVAYQKLNRELKEMKRNDPGFVEKQKQLKALKEEINGINSASGGGVQTTMSGIAKSATSIYLAVAAAIAGVVALGRQILLAYEEAEVANRKLMAAVGGNKQTFRDLATEAGMLQKKLGIDDETTKGLMVYGIETGKSTEMVKKMLEAATELSALTGDDLDSAFKKINATFNGTSGKLSKIDADFGNLTKTQLENGGAVDLILKKYGGLAEQSVQPTKLLSAAWEELKETMGGALSFLTPLIQGITKYVNSFNAETKTANEQFQDQVRLVNNLSSNIPQLLDRYDQLKSKTSLSKDEQKEMLEIVGKVQNVFPGAVTAFDNYGNAIAISTERTRDFINAQAAAMKVLNKKAIDETRERIKGIIEEQAKMIPIMSQITSRGTYKITELKAYYEGTKTYTKTIVRDATQEEVKAYQESYRKLLAQKKEYYDAINGLSGDYLKLEAERVEASNKGNESMDDAYQQLTERITAQESEMKNLLASNKKVPAEMQKAYNELLRQKKEIDNKMGGSQAAKITSDAIEDIGKKIKNLDAQINNAIVAGNTPLAQKLTIEKQAAEQLLETYKAVKVEIEKGWDVDQRDLGPIERLVPMGAKLAKSLNPKAPTLLKKEKTGIEPATPEEAAQAVRDRVAAEESTKQQLNKQIQDAAFASATSINNAIFDLTRNRQQAEFEHKMSLLEKQKEKELSNKKLTESQKAAIEEKYALQEAKLKTDLFKKQQKASIIQAIINGAVAITKTFAELGFIAGAPAAAAMAVATAAEVSVIKSQKPPQFSKGGFTDKDISDYKPTGIVHANEFVGNAIAVRNPTVKRVFDIVDYAQKTGTISQINLPALVADNTLKGRKIGGYTSDDTNTPFSGSSVNNTDVGYGFAQNDLAVMREFTAELKQIREQGIKGKWVLNDLEKIQKNKTDIQNATDM